MFIQGNGFEFSFLLFLHYKSHDRIIFRKYVKAGEKKKKQQQQNLIHQPRCQTTTTIIILVYFLPVSKHF